MLLVITHVSLPSYPSTRNLTLSGTQTIDGVSCVADDRVLVKDQSSAPENGVYVVAAGAWARADDVNAAAEINNALVTVAQGTTNANTGWYQSAEVTTLGSDTVTFVQFFGAGTYTADGQGLEVSGSTFSLELDGSTLSKGPSGIKVANGGISNDQVNASAAIAQSKLSLAITDSEVDGGAGVARSKLASGTANHVVINDGLGNFSSEATLAKSRGGAGSDMSSVTFPSSGTLATTTTTNAVAANYTILDDDGYSTILVTTSTTDRTITLPTASANTGRSINCG